MASISVPAAFTEKGSLVLTKKGKTVMDGINNMPKAGLEERPTQTSAFLNLPMELRFAICRYVIKREKLPIKRPKIPNLAFVCRELRQTSMMLYFSSSCFEIANLDVLDSMTPTCFLPGATDAVFLNIRHFFIKWRLLGDTVIRIEFKYDAELNGYRLVRPSQTPTKQPYRPMGSTLKKICALAEQRVIGALTRRSGCFSTPQNVIKQLCREFPRPLIKIPKFETWDD